MSETTKRKEYKYLMFISMLYITIMLCAILFIYKPVKMWVGFASGATLIFAFWFVLSDIVAEVYGFKISKKMLWSGFSCQFIFSVACLIMLNTPSPDTWHDLFAFNLVVGHLLKITCVAFFTVLISGYVNIYLVTRWKVLLKGRYFWLRSIAASAIGEGIYSVIAVVLIQYKMTPWSNIPMIIFWAYIFKLTCTILLASPASFICTLLKKSEGIDIYEKATLNPFDHLK